MGNSDSRSPKAPVSNDSFEQRMRITRQSSHFQTMEGVILSPTVWTNLLRSMISESDQLEQIESSQDTKRLHDITEACEYKVHYMKMKEGKKSFIRIDVAVTNSDEGDFNIQAFCAEVETEIEAMSAPSVLSIGRTGKGRDKKQVNQASETHAVLHACRFAI